MSQPPRRGISTTSLLRLLVEGRPEQICAAAIVLGALTPKDRRVVPALVRASDAAPPTVRPYIIEALAHQRDPRALRHLERDLLAGGGAREQAIHVLPWFGIEALERLERLRRKVAPDHQASFARIYARIADPKAMDLCLDLLQVDDFELAKVVVRSLRTASAEWPTTQVHELADRVALRLALPLSTTARIGCLKLIADIGREEHADAALGLIGPNETLVVRYTALEALQKLPVPDPTSWRAALIPIVGRGLEEPHLATHALRALRRTTLTRDDAEVLAPLADAEDSELARLAMRSLAEIAPDQALDRLLQDFTRASDTRQELAAQVLATTGIGTLELTRLHDEEHGRPLRERIRKLVHGRGGSLPAGAIAHFVERAADASLSEEERVERLLLAAALDGRATAEAILALAEAAIGRLAWPEAINLLEPLVRHRLATVEGRFRLAIAHLAVWRPDAPDLAAHWTRAIQLLTPLSRLPEFHLGPRIAAVEALHREAVLALIEEFRRRPDDQSRVAEALLPHPSLTT